MGNVMQALVPLVFTATLLACSGLRPAMAQESPSGRLEEVIVTAQKRAQRMQDVPISISVLSAAELDESAGPGITELLNRVPGVAATVGVQGGQTQLGVRGVTASSPLFSGSSPIAFYLDSIPFGLVISGIVPDVNAYDLDRIEVLRGPQGTLYGANALNGVVRVLTKDAVLDDFELKARLSASTSHDGGDNHRGDLALNVPLVAGKLAARAVAGEQRWGGWVDSPVRNDIDTGVIRNYRLKLDAQPADGFAIGVSGWRTVERQDAPSTANEAGRVAALVDKQPIDSEVSAFGLRLQYAAPVMSIESRSSYLEYDNRGSLWVAAGLPYFATRLHSKIVAEELVVNSTLDGPWRWSAGAFYRDGRDHAVQTYTSPITDQSQTSRSAAIFGEVGRRLLDDKVEWTLGLRYFRDEVGQIDGTRSIADDTFDATTPRVVLAWRPSATLSVYSSYSQGFRSGFPQGALVFATAPDFPSVEPDKLRNYEVGAKGSVQEGRLSFDAAVYYIDWRGIQQTIFIPIGNGLFAFAPINTSDGGGVGVDVWFSGRPNAAIELSLSASWNALELESDVYSMNRLLFAAGQRLNRSPEWTVGAAASYRFSFGRSGYTGLLATSANYTSKMGAAVIGEPPVYADAIRVVRASMAIESASFWTVSVFGENLGNEDGVVIKQYGNPDWDARVRPRTVGVQLELRF